MSETERSYRIRIRRIDEPNEAVREFAGPTPEAAIEAAQPLLVLESDMPLVLRISGGEGFGRRVCEAFRCGDPDREPEPSWVSLAYDDWGTFEAIRDLVGERWLDDLPPGFHVGFVWFGDEMEAWITDPDGTRHVVPLEPDPYRDETTWYDIWDSAGESVDGAVGTVFRATVGELAMGIPVWQWAMDGHVERGNAGIEPSVDPANPKERAAFIKEYCRGDWAWE